MTNKTLVRIRVWVRAWIKICMRTRNYTNFHLSTVWDAPSSVYEITVIRTHTNDRAFVSNGALSRLALFTNLDDGNVVFMVIDIENIHGHNFEIRQVILRPLQPLTRSNISSQTVHTMW